MTKEIKVMKATINYQIALKNVLNIPKAEKLKRQMKENRK